MKAKKKGGLVEGDRPRRFGRFFYWGASATSTDTRAEMTIVTGTLRLFKEAAEPKEPGSIPFPVEEETKEILLFLPPPVLDE
jgi:hypothetical protein